MEVTMKHYNCTCMYVQMWEVMSGTFYWLLHEFLDLFHTWRIRRLCEHKFLQTNKQQNKTKSEQLTLTLQLCTLHLVSLSRKLTWRLTPLISLNDDSSSSLLVWNGSLTSDCEESWCYSIYQLMYQPKTITTTNPTNYHRTELSRVAKWELMFPQHTCSVTASTRKHEFTHWK